MNNAHNDMIFRMLRMINQGQNENIIQDKRKEVDDSVKEKDKKNNANEQECVINFSRKKKKKCRHCKTKKCIAYKNCEYCSKFYCIKCCGPATHECKNLEEYREKERNRLEKKLMSADSNFSKMDKI